MSGKKQANDSLVLPVTARWRILGWIMLTTVMVMLLIILTARAIFQNDVLYRANGAILQEVQEFRTFAEQAIDSKTHKPFTSLSALMERYMERQTPDLGEAFISVTSSEVLVVDNAKNDAGERLAGDRNRLNELLDDKENSGVLKTGDGQLYWGKSVVTAGDQTGTLLVAEFVQSGMEDVRRNMMLLFGIMLVGVLLTAVIAWMVAGQILAPITRFSEISSRVGAFDLSTRLPETGRDELSKLARSINAMLDRISGAHADQRHVLSETLRQVQILTTELEAARTVVGNAGAALTQPMTSLRQLNQDLALLLDSGRADFLKLQEVQISPFVYAMAEDFRKLLPGRSWRVTDVAEARVRLDTQRIRQSMLHLATNAFDHTKEGDRIELGSSLRTLADGQRMASIWIANRGPSLTEADAKALFETPPDSYARNHQMPLKINQETPAMGMGLAVVKAMAHAHGGYAWLESGGQRGTVFGVDIPLYRPRPTGGGEQTQENALDAMSQEKS
ncbi:MAG: HAMP domain-containing sensor histidine kinase [Lautropia sp.]|nr:HAMP domain-containing sensor histidine kinase [Lautropia sp.]